MRKLIALLKEWDMEDTKILLGSVFVLFGSWFIVSFLLLVL